MYSLGSDRVYGGYTIWEVLNGGWHRITGGAMRIALDREGVLWVVTEANKIFKRVMNKQRNVFEWHQIPGSAKDISIGADGSIFILGLS